RGPSPAPSSAWRARSSGRAAERCCSTKSRRCGSISRPSCSEYCKSRSSSASADRRPSRWTCGSSPPPTATWPRTPPRGISGIPPLRDRKEDIALLAYRFATQYAQEIKKEISGLAPGSIELLSRYDWPGNVRELQHAVERAVILTSDPIIRAHAFDAQRFGLS